MSNHINRLYLNIIIAVVKDKADRAVNSSMSISFPTK